MSDSLNGNDEPTGYMWLRQDVTGMPSIALFHKRGADRGWFVVVDPAARRRILSDGRASAGGLRKRTAALVIAASAVLTSVVAMVIPADAVVANRLVVGAVCGLVVGGVLAAILHAVLDQRRRSAYVRAGIPLSRIVRPDNGRAWSLCEVAAQIAHCPAWRKGIVDAGRQVPAILWAAVGRSLAVEQQRRDAERALQHDSLRELAQETLARTDRELESLDTVEENLKRVLLTAWSVDRQPAQSAREAEAARRRRAEEQDLRARLSNSAVVDDVAESNEQVDRSAGLLAEVAAVSQLLAATERMLRDSESST